MPLDPILGIMLQPVVQAMSVIAVTTVFRNLFVAYGGLNGQSEVTRPENQRIRHGSAHTGCTIFLTNLNVESLTGSENVAEYPTASCPASEVAPVTYPPVSGALQ